MANPLKNMNMGDMKQLMQEAKKYEKQMEEKIKNIIEQEKKHGGIVRKEEFDKLQERVEELENKLQ